VQIGRGVSQVKHELTFEWEKDTKNTRKYEEVERVGQAKVIGSLYVQKHAANGVERLKVTIEAGE
jgi:hypothetical protein